MSSMTNPNDRAESPSTNLRVRPYLLTGGRTQSDIELALETLLRTTELGQAKIDELHLENEQIVTLCLDPISVTELAARLQLPLQVTRVLVGDLVNEGLVQAHATADFATDRPDLTLLERVLDGLQSL